MGIYAKPLMTAREVSPGDADALSRDVINAIILADILYAKAAADAAADAAFAAGEAAGQEEAGADTEAQRIMEAGESDVGPSDYEPCDYYETCDRGCDCDYDETCECARRTSGDH